MRLLLSLFFHILLLRILLLLLLSFVFAAHRTTNHKFEDFDASLKSALDGSSGKIVLSM